MTDTALQSAVDESLINRILNLYAAALDRRDWQALEQVFTDDATAHYHGIGHFEGREAIVMLVRKALEQCGPTQHLLGTVLVDVDGDHASASCYLQAIHLGKGAYEGQRYTVWGEYRDRLSRTAGGWRIVHRELAGIHNEGDIGLSFD